MQLTPPASSPSSLSLAQRQPRRVCDARNAAIAPPYNRFKKLRAGAGDESLNVHKERTSVQFHRHLVHQLLKGRGSRHLRPFDLHLLHFNMQLVSRNVGHANVRSVKRVQGRLHLRLLYNPMLALQHSVHGMNVNVCSAKMGSFRHHQLHNGIVDGEMLQILPFLLYLSSRLLAVLMSSLRAVMTSDA
ncbi:hypothetical protein B0H19DRAFT_1248738 [Mycena capillaripes]|nr:hypothetical protein B0H19DRAFT_1248738 [Mycena capillaripes]